MQEMPKALLYKRIQREYKGSNALFRSKNNPLQTIRIYSTSCKVIRNNNEIFFTLNT